MIYKTPAGYMNDGCRVCHKTEAAARKCAKAMVKRALRLRRMLPNADIQGVGEESK